MRTSTPKLVLSPSLVGIGSAMVAISLLGPWYTEPVGAEHLRYDNISAWQAFAVVDIVLLACAAGGLLLALGIRTTASRAVARAAFAVGLVACGLIAWRGIWPAGPTSPYGDHHLYETTPVLVFAFFGGLAILWGGIVGALDLARSEAACPTSGSTTTRP